MKTILMILLSLLVVGCSDATGPILQHSTPHPTPRPIAVPPVRS